MKPSGPSEADTIKVMGRAILELMARVRALEERAVRIKPSTVKPPLGIFRRAVVRQLVTEAALREGISEADITGHSRLRKFAWPRQWVMFEAQKRGLSTPQIGAVLNRDHTTILSGIKAEAARRSGQRRELCT